MNVRVVSKVNITASPKAVFKYLKHLKYHYLWNPHLRDISPAAPLKLGAAYETESLLLGVTVRGSNKVTRFVPDRELQIENRTGSIQYSVNYKLAAKSGGVLLTCTTKVSLRGKAFRFTASVLRTLAKRELQTDLRALKIAVEQQLPRPE